MLELNDFFHLPEVDGLVEQLVADEPGLIVVAGLDPRPLSPGSGKPGESFLPSGRAAIFGILARRLLALHDGPVMVVTAAKDALRLPDAARRRIRHAVDLDEAQRHEPSILILDQITAENAAGACLAARQGIRVLAQLDCVFAGAQIARHLLDLGVPPDLLRDLAGRAWAVAVQRQPALCPVCRRPVDLDAFRAAELQARYPHLQLTGSFYDAGPGCPSCTGGFAGDVAVFDFFRAPDLTDPGTLADAQTMRRLMDQRSLLPMEEYLLRLAQLGRVALDDLLHFEAGQLRRTYRLLAAGERALAAANITLSSHLAELETAHRVLQQRTESLVSLQETAQALSTSVELDDLARRICRQVHDLCHADRIILYLLRPDMKAQVLAVDGWDPGLRGKQLDALQVFGADGAPDAVTPAAAGPAPFKGWPPGIAPVNPDVAGATLRAGLRVPLIAQHEVVGLMIAHSTLMPRFGAGETALLQTLANQAAVAIQRTGLIEALRAKIAELQAAQAELIQKERLDHELELARQVQQSLLPRVFPPLPGFRCAARSESARRVGGDLYDVFTLDDTHFGLMIADVSDKGMPAALYMTLTRSLLLAEARRDLSPQRVLNSVHRLLLELGDPEMFVTVFYGVVDTVARSLTYVRAGHEEGILLRAGELITLSGQGTVLGLFELAELPLSEEQVVLQAGDRLVLYTDGMLDALASDGNAYGLERLRRFLVGQAGEDPADLCAAAFAELAAYQGATEQFDDMALLALAVD